MFSIFHNFFNWLFGIFSNRNRYPRAEEKLAIWHYTNRFSYRTTIAYLSFALRDWQCESKFIQHKFPQVVFYVYNYRWPFYCYKLVLLLASSNREIGEELSLYKVIISVGGIIELSIFSTPKKISYWDASKVYDISDWTLTK